MSLWEIASLEQLTIAEMITILQGLADRHGDDAPVECRNVHGETDRCHRVVIREREDNKQPIIVIEH